MNIKAEYIAGGLAIGLLLWYAFTHKGDTTVVNNQAPVFNVPAIPPASIYNFPPAPDLKNFVLAGVGQIPSGGGGNPQNIMTQPSPCACSGCNDNGLASQVTQTVADFTKTIVASMGSTFDTYMANLTGALPSYIQQYLNNPQSQNAANILSQQAAAIQSGGGAPKPSLLGVNYTQATAYAFQGGYLGAGGTLTGKDVGVNVNNYTPGQVLTIG